MVFFDKGGTDTVANNCEYKNRWPEFEEFSSAASSGAPEKVSAEQLEALRAR